MGAVIGGTNAFDYSLYADFEDEANYWTPSKIVTYILYQLNNQTVDEFPTEKRHAFFSPITNTQLELFPATSNWADNEQKSSDLLIGSDSVWATLVQLVEVNGPYTLGIDYLGGSGTDYATIVILEAS